MTLIDFDAVDTVETTVVTPAPPVVITERVTVTPIASAKHVLKPESEWGWEEVRDYVVRAIEDRHGPFPRNFKTESGIFKGFVKRWGSQAPAIARFAFEQTDGMWKGAPISVTRFCAGSDPYFSAPIAQRLA